MNWQGKGKVPSKALYYLVKEINALKKPFNIMVNGEQKKISVIVAFIMGDLLGKHEYLGIRGPTGYFACLRCEAKGQRVGGTIRFPPNVNAALRSHSTLLDSNGNLSRHAKQTGWDNATAILKLFSFDPIRGSPIDIMHNLDTILKRFMYFTFSKLMYPDIINEEMDSIKRPPFLKRNLPTFKRPTRNY